MSKKYAQPEAQRFARAATRRPFEPRDRDDLTPLPQEIPGDMAYRRVERLEPKLSDARALIGKLESDHKQTAATVQQLVEARKEDRIHMRWLVTTIVSVSLGAAVASFTSCIHQREDIAQIKTTLEHILKEK